MTLEPYFRLIIVLSLPLSLHSLSPSVSSSFSRCRAAFFFRRVHFCFSYLVFLPSSLSCISPPLRRLFLSFGQVEFSLSLFFISFHQIGLSPSRTFLPLLFIPNWFCLRRSTGYPTFVRTHSLSLALCFMRTLSRSILTNTPLFSLSPSLFLSPAYTHTYIHTRAFIRTRTCQPRLGSTKYARVSPRATTTLDDVLSVCVTRTRIHVCIYARAASDSSRSHLYA